MSIKFTCDDKQTLVSYVYGEIDQDTRQAVDAHLASCQACSAEVTALGDARAGIGLWMPPDVELDFAIVKKSQLPAANVLRPARWWTTVPAWAQAAAALLVLAAATSRRVQQLIAAAEQRHDRELAVRFVEFTRDINMQRRADMQNIGRGMVNYEDQLQRQRQTINNLIRVSATQQ